MLSLICPAGMQPAFAADNLSAMSGPPRQLVRAIQMSDGNVMAIGGNDGMVHLNSTVIYNPVANAWTSGAPLLHARFSHAATLLQDGRILVAGGNNFDTGVMTSVEIYNPTTNSWSAAASLSTPRASASASTLPDGRVLVAGGGNDDGDLSSTEIYNPTTNTWTAGPNMPASRKEHSAAILGDGRILVTGGMVGGSMSASAIVYDAVLNNWSAAADLPTKRYVHASASLIDGRVAVSGGFDPTYMPLTSTAIYDPETNEWVAGVNMNVGRLAHDSVLMSDGKVFVVGGAGNSGPMGSSESHQQQPRTGMPKASRTPGEVASGTEVELSASTVGAILYYTTDGTTPTLSSPVYIGPITVDHTMTIRAIAHRNDWGSSRAMSAHYTVTAPPAATPSANPAGGAVASGTTVSLTTATDGATIHYTTDGSAPTASSPVYSAPIAVASPQTIKAIAAKNGMTDSAIMTEAYTLMAQATMPTANPAGGAVASGTTVSLTTATDGATIHYTTDGSAPTGSSPVYSAPIAVTSPQTIKAIAVKGGMTDSAIMTEAYTLMAQATMPTANPGFTGSGMAIALTTATDGATIHYTTDGSAPTASSPVYTAPIPIAVSQTIKAIAVKSGMTDSAEMMFVVMVHAAKPAANPAGGAVASGTTVALTTATDGATIHYTTDGSAPTASSPVYSAPIAVTSAQTINAIAVKSGLENSASMSESYTIAAPPVQLPTAPTENTKAVSVLVNGKVENAGTVTTGQAAGRMTASVAVDAQKLEQRLAETGNGALITIPVNVAAQVATGELNGQMVKNMESKQAVVEVRTNQAAYTLPARQINIDAISQQVGSDVELQDIKVRIEISEPVEETVQLVRQAASSGNFTLVVPAVEFSVRASYGDLTVEVDRFNSFVERTIAIPDGVDPSRITTGVVVEPNGTTRHVPTKVIQAEGKYFAKINSLTNSTYSVVWHPLEFADAVEHWAQEAVNDMGSRMVVGGFEDGTFKPDEKMTRAEFASIVVRGLGLKLEKGKVSFSDVQSSEWYADAVATAADYGLINGYADGAFRPQDNITREQAMTILAKAMAISGLKERLIASGAGETANAFVDADSIAEWAKAGVSETVEAGIVSGRVGNVLDPKADVSRAEVSVMVRNLLQKSGLI
jgi:N-acetylneuraminic acid mutarotase/transcription elongation GreA/GreB family factor